MQKIRVLILSINYSHSVYTYLLAKRPVRTISHRSESRFPSIYCLIGHSPDVPSIDIMKFYIFLFLSRFYNFKCFFCKFSQLKK